MGRNYCKTIYILVSYSTLFSYQDVGIKNVLGCFYSASFTVHLLQCIFYSASFSLLIAYIQHADLKSVGILAISITFSRLTQDAIKYLTVYEYIP